MLIFISGLIILFGKFCWWRGLKWFIFVLLNQFLGSDRRIAGAANEVNPVTWTNLILDQRPRTQQRRSWWRRFISPGVGAGANNNSAEYTAHKDTPEWIIGGTRDSTCIAVQRQCIRLYINYVQTGVRWLGGAKSGNCMLCILYFLI